MFVIFIKAQFPPNFLQMINQLPQLNSSRLDDVAPVQENIAANISIGNDVVQGEEHEANDEGNFNDPMEVDHDDSNETIHINDGTNQMLQELYGESDDDGGDSSDGIYDVPLIERSSERLFEHSNATLLSATLLLVNLKVMNNLSNRCMTQLLRYAICIYDHIYINFDYFPFF